MKIFSFLHIALLRRKKGQAAITDLFIAVAIFIVLIALTTLIWNLYNARLESRLDYDTMVLKGYYIADGFVKSPGYPEDWETLSSLNQTQLIGLAEYDHVISDAKVAKFASLSDASQPTYASMKNIMRLNLYDYYFVLKDQQGVILYSGGRYPSGKFTVNLARVVLYNNQPYILEFAIWKL